MSDNTHNQGKPQEQLDLPEERPDGGLNFYNTEQVKNFGTQLVEKAFIQAKYGLSKDDAQKMSAPVSRPHPTSTQDKPLSLERDPAKLRTLLPTGTLMQSYFDSLLKLMPNPGDSTDTFQFFETHDPELDMSREKQMKIQLKNTIDAINTRLQQKSVAPFFRLKKGEIIRLR